jgi:hypothetical protein
VDAVCEKFAHQIATTIDWAAGLESCRAAGAEKALELGPALLCAEWLREFFLPAAALVQRKIFEPWQGCEISHGND